MAMLDNTGHTNGAKKTRQGKGKNTREWLGKQTVHTFGTQKIPKEEK